MRIFLTGGTGFVGRHLIRALQAKGYDICCLARDDQFLNGFPEYDGHIKITLAKGDLTDQNSLTKIIEQVRPDIVVHLAALTPVRFSYAKPAEYAQVNYIGTVNLIQAIVNSGIRLTQFVHGSTAEVYRSKNGYITEDDALFGGTPYGISKASADYYVQMVHLAYGLPTTILRPTNTFGRTFDLPEESRGYLVEKAAIQMLTSNIAEFDGFSDRKRCWMHIDDHVNSYESVIDSDSALGEIFNVSTNNASTVGDLVHKIASLCEFEGAILWGRNPRPYDPPSLCIDGSKLMKMNGWSPSRSLMEGLERTVEYWKAKLRAPSREIGLDTNVSR